MSHHVIIMVLDVEHMKSYAGGDSIYKMEPAIDLRFYHVFYDIMLYLDHGPTLGTHGAHVLMRIFKQCMHLS